MLEKVISWAVPFVLGGAATGIITYIKMRRKRNTAIENAVQCLLRAEIIHYHEKYMEREACPIYARESLDRMYKAYHALDGNDVATQLYEEVMALPVKK